MKDTFWMVFFMCKLKRKPTSMFTQKNAPRQKMILLFLCILNRRKSTPSGGEVPKPGKVVCDCGWEAENQSLLSTGSTSGHWLPYQETGLRDIAPSLSPATFPAYSQVTRLSAAAFGGISLPPCGRAEGLAAPLWLRGAFLIRLWNEGLRNPFGGRVLCCYLIRKACGLMPPLLMS